MTDPSLNNGHTVPNIPGYLSLEDFSLLLLEPFFIGPVVASSSSNLELNVRAQGPAFPGPG